MNTFWDWIPCAAIRQPSMNLCGTRRMISRSLNEPGSDSSAFATTYAGLVRLSGGATRLILRPIGKPAPPRRIVSSVATELLHDRRNLIRADRLAVAMVDHDYRRVPAATGTLDQPE